MKKTVFFILLLFWALQLKAQTIILDNLLKKHVNNNGWVNYTTFKNELEKLDNYIVYLTKTTPNKKWSKNKEKAFWINAYNAYTIKLILENYPLKSILDFKINEEDAWNIPFAKIGGKYYTLNAIEHEILRKKFNDPRIHVGINCASVSCPKLANFAFTEKNVDSKLEDLMKKFINDNSRNKINSKKIKLSKIFEWFTEDFTKKGSLIDYLNQYSSIKINKKAKISFLNYDWKLNKQ